VDNHARAIRQAAVQVTGFRLSERRPQNLNPVRERISDNHSISPSLRGRDDTAAVFAEQRIGHRNPFEQNAFRYAAVGALLDLARAFR
jgi:hypothetical protein